MLIVHPGELSLPVALTEVLREAHEVAREARAKEIEGRKAKRIPLDDTTNWQEVGEAVAAASLAHGERDTAKVAEAARLLLVHTEGNALEPLPEYVPAPELAGIVCTFRMVADRDRRGWSARLTAAWRRYRDALVADDPIALRDADEAITAVYEDQVAACVAKLDGIEGLRDSVADSLPGLRLAGLLLPLQRAVGHFLSLPPGKALRCGQPAPST